MLRRILRRISYQQNALGPENGRRRVCVTFVSLQYYYYYYYVFERNGIEPISFV